MSKELIKAVPHLDGVLYVSKPEEIKVGDRYLFFIDDEWELEADRCNTHPMIHPNCVKIIAKSNLNIEGVPYAFIEHDPKAKLFSEENLNDAMAQASTISGDIDSGLDPLTYEEIKSSIRPTPIGYELAESFTVNDKQYIKLKPVYDHKII